MAGARRGRCAGDRACWQGYVYMHGYIRRLPRPISGVRGRGRLGLVGARLELSLSCRPLEELETLFHLLMTHLGDVEPAPHPSTCGNGGCCSCSRRARMYSGAMLPPGSTPWRRVGLEVCQRGFLRLVVLTDRFLCVPPFRHPAPPAARDVADGHTPITTAPKIRHCYDTRHLYGCWWPSGYRRALGLTVVMPPPPVPRAG